MELHLSKGVSTPGQALKNLKDRRSMSRLDGVKEEAKTENAIRELNSTGKKFMEKPTLNRDLSVPRLRQTQKKPTDDLMTSPLKRV